MNRQHTREDYIDLVKNIRALIPKCTISQDMICGFPSETEQNHQDTLSLMEEIKYSFGFMYAYSERPGTMAARKLKDDVAFEVKKRRLAEVVELQRSHGLFRTKQFINQTVEILIEKESKKSSAEWSGRSAQNSVAVFPKGRYKIGDFVMVKINDCTSATLIGEAIGFSENN
jgi:tRNA-2-methylthio-N6-dimethylallyladenosine synthase